MSTPRRAQLKEAGPFPGTRRFEVRRVLGEGGMGIVYDAFDRERNMSVALKTLRWIDAKSIFLLKTEFRVRADLEHRNLVRLGELHHEEGHWFFTMELVEGVDFLTWVRSTETSEHASLFDERRLRAAMRQLAAGLSTLHHTNMIHRDIKPSNVMVTAEGRVARLRPDRRRTRAALGHERRRYGGVHVARASNVPAAGTRVRLVLRRRDDVSGADRAVADRRRGAARDHDEEAAPPPAAARRRSGELLGGELGARIVADADAVLHRHGVMNPTSFARAFATRPTCRDGG